MGIKSILGAVFAFMLLITSNNVTAALVEITFAGNILQTDIFGSNEFGFAEGQSVSGALTMNSSLAGSDTDASATGNAYSGTQSDWMDYSISINGNSFHSSGGGTNDVFWSSARPDDFYASLTIRDNDASGQLDLSMEHYDVWSLMPVPITPEDEIAFSSGSPDSPHDTWSAFNFSQNGTDYYLVFSLESFSIDNPEITSVPLPAAVWLFGSGLFGLVGLARRKT